MLICKQDKTNKEGNNMANIKIPVKPEKDLLKLAQKSRQVTQEIVANRLNVKRNALNQNMNRTRMSLDTFAKVLAALDYDIVIMDQDTGEVCWKLEVEMPEIDYESDI